MKLLIAGPAGSGKTTWVLENLRGALRAGNTTTRLLVPTATLAQHLQNSIAREGFVVRTRAVETLSRFLDAQAGPDDPPQVSEAVLYLVVEQAARAASRPEFARVAGMPGFSASLARAIAEFSSAGCNAARLAQNLPDTPLGKAFLAIYERVERELARRGLALRAQRLEAVAERISREGVPGVDAIFLDGFHALPDPELGIVAALSRRADVAITLADGAHTAPVRARLFELGFEERRFASRRPSPAVQLVKAPTLEREADEIARRILEQAGAGRPFREMGVVVRKAALYEPVLRAAFGRFGIPARFYFDARLEEHAISRFLCGAVEAMLGGWEHEATLAVLRLTPRFATFVGMDRFDFAVRKQLPGSGLGALHELAADEQRIARLLTALGELEWWRTLELAPRDWAARFKTLRGLYGPARPPEPATHETALEWRAQAEVLQAFDAAAEETARAIGTGTAIPLAEFYNVFRSVLRLTPLRVPDDRRNVVHVLSAHEARQWELPVVFVCGLVEKQFPSTHEQDPFFPDAARCRLHSAGIRVRTAAEFEVDERALFDAAISRATMLLTLSYPEYDAAGSRNLRSVFLEDMPLAPVAPKAVKPRPMPQPPTHGIAAIESPDLLEYLARKTETISPTALEMYGQCPFQYFGAKLLRIQEPPKRPQERFDFMLQGSVVHAVLQEWYLARPPIEPLFARIFDEACERENVPPGYRLERLRECMLNDLVAFAEDGRWQRDGFESRVELAFRLPLEGVILTGKIDRLDVLPDRSAFVIDYKYSGAFGTKQRLQKETLLQPQLYLLAAQRLFECEPAGMFYIGLRGGVQYAGWSAMDTGIKAEEIPPNWLETAEERAVQSVREIRAGRILATPADGEGCGYCALRDVCRYTEPAGAAAGEGA